MRSRFETAFWSSHPVYRVQQFAYLEIHATDAFAQSESRATSFAWKHAESSVRHVKPGGSSAQDAGYASCPGLAYPLPERARCVDSKQEHLSMANRETIFFWGLIGFHSESSQRKALTTFFQGLWKRIGGFMPRFPRVRIPWKSRKYLNARS